MPVYIGESPPDRAESAQTLVRAGRIMSGKTQEELAELLHIDPRTLRRYESGEDETPDDIMYAVAKLADCQLLLYKHFKFKYRIQDDILPEVESFPLAQAVVTLLAELQELERNHVASRLLAMAADGVIDTREKADFNFVMQKLDGVRQAVELMRYCRKDYE